MAAARAAHANIAAAIAASAQSCAHCGKQGSGFQRCSRCKQAWYCGAACQNAGWKRHKKTSAPPVPLVEVNARLTAADAAGDWEGVLKWEGRMEELLVGRSDEDCENYLAVFAFGSQKKLNKSGSKAHALSCILLHERRIELLGNLQRFRDQAALICKVASLLPILNKTQESASYFQRARDIGVAHGFISSECQACLGLGTAAMKDRRHEEAADLLRNALAAVPLTEDDDNAQELSVLSALSAALLLTNAFEEAEELVLRYREAAKAESKKRGGFCFYDIESLFKSAMLLEARGRPQEAAGDVRALLDLLRQNEKRVQSYAAACEEVLVQASGGLAVLSLDPEVGEAELVESVAVELAKLRSLIG